MEPIFDLDQQQLEQLHSASLQESGLIDADGRIRFDSLQGAILISNDHYLYQQKVSNDPLTFTYKFLSPQTLSRAFSLEAIDSGWTDPNIIRSGSNSSGDWAVLWVARQKHRITITRADEDSPELELTVPLPAMIFAGLDKAYWVWAVSEPTFSPKAQLMRAPLPNVYPGGRICWGANRPTAASAQTLPQAWQLFISSLFSRHSVSGKSIKFPNNIIDQLRTLTRRRAYPVTDLQPVGNYYTSSADEVLNAILKPN